MQYSYILFSFKQLIEQSYSQQQETHWLIGLQGTGPKDEAMWVSNSDAGPDWIDTHLSNEVENGKCVGLQSPHGEVFFYECLDKKIEKAGKDILKEPLCEFGKEQNIIFILSMQF